MRIIIPSDGTAVTPIEVLGVVRAIVEVYVVASVLSTERYHRAMCRSIKRLREGTVAASEDEIREASLQFVRKISGFRAPSKGNEDAFSKAVDDIAAVSQRLLTSLVIGRTPVA